MTGGILRKPARKRRLVRPGTPESPGANQCSSVARLPAPAWLRASWPCAQWVLDAISPSCRRSTSRLSPQYRRFGSLLIRLPEHECAPGRQPSLVHRERPTPTFVGRSEPPENNLRPISGRIPSSHFKPSDPGLALRPSADASALGGAGRTIFCGRSSRAAAALDTRATDRRGPAGGQ